MMKKKYIKIVIIVVVISLMFICLKACFGTDGLMPMLKISDEKIVKIFEKNEELFYSITEYMNSYTYDLWIGKDDDFENGYEVRNGRQVINIGNSQFQEKLSYIIKKLKYQYIYEAGNGIYFVRQTGPGYSQGVVYIEDGKEPDWVIITKKYRINDNWFYFNKY
jgi:hypothetical protein